MFFRPQYFNSSQETFGHSKVKSSFFNICEITSENKDGKGDNLKNTFKNNIQIAKRSISR